MYIFRQLLLLFNQQTIVFPQVDHFCVAIAVHANERRIARANCTLALTLDTLKKGKSRVSINNPAVVVIACSVLGFIDVLYCFISYF